MCSDTTTTARSWLITIRRESGAKGSSPLRREHSPTPNGKPVSRHDVDKLRLEHRVCVLRVEAHQRATLAPVEVDPLRVEDRSLDVDGHPLLGAKRGSSPHLVAAVPIRRGRRARNDGLHTQMACKDFSLFERATMIVNPRELGPRGPPIVLTNPWLPPGDSCPGQPPVWGPAFSETRMPAPSARDPVPSGSAGSKSQPSPPDTTVQPQLGAYPLVRGAAPASRSNSRRTGKTEWGIWRSRGGVRGAPQGGTRRRNPE